MCQYPEQPHANKEERHTDPNCAGCLIGLMASLKHQPHITLIGLRLNNKDSILLTRKAIATAKYESLPRMVSEAVA